MFKKKVVKRKLAVVLSASLALTSVAWWQTEQPAGAEDSQTAVGVNVAYHTQEEIRSYAQRTGVKLDDALKFAENPITEAPYSLGKLSEKTLNSALAMVNQIRYIAGISDQVTLSEDYNELVQAAALANYANNKLSHYPEQPAGMSDEMYALARTGASSANIAWASWPNRSMNGTIVNSWMEDGDASNIARVGHRRWILNPSMAKTGFGAVSGRNGTYSAVYAFDRTNRSAQEYGVMWPAQNMPVEYFSEEFPWSISMGSRVDASKVQVVLTREKDGKVWRFSENSSDGAFYVNNDSYGQSGCIIFRPDAGIDRYAAGDVFKVDITGLSSGDVSYTVNFFQLIDQAATTPANKTLQKGDAVTVSGMRYVVTNASGKTVKCVGVKNKKKTSVVVPATIKVNSGGKMTSYKITAVEKKAFAGNKTLKKVTIGKNVKSIGKDAFKNCSKLKAIAINSSGITKVGTGALKGTAKNLVIRVPAKKVKAYKKIFKNKGNRRMAVRKS